MHLTELRQILRDADVAYAIRPIVASHLLTLAQTTEALSSCGVERSAGVAQIALALPAQVATI